MKPTYKTPLTTYHKFINAFQRRNGKSRSNDWIVRNGNILWETIKSNTDQLDEFINSAPPEKQMMPKKRLTLFQSFYKKGDNIQEKRRQEDTITENQGCSSNHDAIVTSVSVNRQDELPNQADAFLDRENYIDKLENHKVNILLKKLCPEILCKDVLENKSFTDPLIQIADSLCNFIDLREKLIKMQRRNKTTELRTNVENANQALNDVSKLLKDASHINVNAAQNLSLLASSSVLKLNKISQALSELLALDSSIKERGLVTAMNRRINQVSGEINQPFTTKSSENFHFLCYNSSAHTFGKGFENLETSSCALYSKYFDKLYKIGQLFDRELFFSTTDLASVLDIPESELEGSLLTLVLKLFPLMKVVSPTGFQIILNLEKLILWNDIFAKITNQGNSGENVCKETVAASRSSPVFDELEESAPAAEKKFGRKAIHKRFPDIIQVTTEFLKQHSFAAGAKRRSSTATGTGVSLDEIREHHFAKRPGVQEYAISNDTIHRLFVPPRQATSAAKYYKSLIDAKVPGKSNRYRENHPDQHFLFSRIGMRDELGQLFKKTCSNIFL